MMPVMQEKWLTSPLIIVKDLFEKRGVEDDWWRAITQYFESKLRSDDGLASVPSLNTVPLEMLRDGCLVRYRAMVQDQFDPEFYFKLYHTTADEGAEVYCGLYSDLTHQSVNWDHPSNVMADRQTLYCVPIPAETQWTKDAYRATVHYNVGNISGEGSTSHLKRKLDEDNSIEVGEAMEEAGGETMEVDNDNPILLHSQKKFCSKEHIQPSNAENLEDHDLNFPLQGEVGLPCLVKVYENFDKFHVTSLLEIVGVLSIHPSLAPLVYEEDAQQMIDTVAERRVHSPPPSLVPRLHAITAKILSNCHPLLPPDLPSPLDTNIITKYLPLEGGVASCRKLALDELAQVLCGDYLAAEYTLLHLLSSIYGRTEVLALGKFSLNIFRCNGQVMTQNFYQLLVNWLTKCFLLPMSLENMNGWRFSPKKDYTSNRLLSGVLQLSPGTQVLVDETALTPGQLTTVGVANLTALGNVIQWQKLSYDFQFHSIEFNCDLPVLILSEGKSILKVDCHIPLVPTTFKTSSSPSAEQTRQLRLYFSLCRALGYNLNPQMQTTLEEEFVTLRQREEPGLNGERFHQLLAMARLVCLSHGSPTLTSELWEHTQTIEKERLQRLNTT